MLFKSKKKSAQALMKAEEAKRMELQKALKASEIKLPEKKEFYPYPKEYMKFLEEVKIRPKTWYEKACNFVEGLFPIELEGKSREKILTNLRAAYINATPRGVLSFAILSTFVWLIMVMFYILYTGSIDIFGGFFFGLALVNFWYFYSYPASKAKSLSIQMSSDTVLAILYMVIYMRSSPNLEGAIKFASQNLEGPLSWDLKKLIWDMETGKYSSANEALVDYVVKWKDKNVEFSESLNLLKNSSVEQSRREMIYDETINVILNGTKERAKHYAAGLRMPMTMIYALGILLPIMGLVMFPIVLIFISDKVKPSFVFFGYDILLPLFLYFVVNQILSSKPPTFSPPDVSKAKGIPKMGKFSLGGVMIPVWPVSLLVSLPFILIGFSGINSPSPDVAIPFSLLAIFGMSLTIVIYMFLDSYQKVKTRNDIEKIENEFASAMFQLGNIIVSGIPLELAIDKVRENLKEMKIAEMFEIISLNMKKFGYTFEEALFDKQVGAIWYYPSRLIQSIMQTIIQSSKKSVKTAASSMIVISNYLRGVHDVKEQIEDILGETTSSMSFLAMFLSPLISGVTVTMAVIILQILERLGSTMQSLMGNADLTVAQSFLLIPWASGGPLPITPAHFQIIVGIYMIETAVLISIFLSGVRYGEDPIGLRSQMWNILLIGVLVYVITWFVTYSMFGGALENLLKPGGI